MPQEKKDKIWHRAGPPMSDDVCGNHTRIMENEKLVSKNNHL